MELTSNTYFIESEDNQRAEALKLFSYRDQGPVSVLPNYIISFGVVLFLRCMKLHGISEIHVKAQGISWWKLSGHGRNFAIGSGCREQDCNIHDRALSQAAQTWWDFSNKNDSNSTRRIIALLELPLSFRQSARQMRVLFFVKTTKNMKLEVKGVFQR